MAPLIKVVLVDAFTKIPGLGNRAGVVLDAVGLSAAEMQAIAREVNVSETAFVLPPLAKDYDMQVRYFTPTREVPICGHATIATHFLRATRYQLPTATVVVKTGAGILPVDIVQEEGDYHIVMTQGAPSIEPPLSMEKIEKISEALGISLHDLSDTLPVQICSTGHSKVIIPVARRVVLNAITPDFDKLCELTDAVGSNGYYVFTLDSPDPGTLVSGRMFAPAIGINEDPVTGNANGPAGAYLYHHGVLKSETDGVISYRALQGETMGKPGIVDVRLHSQGGVLTKVQVAGTAVIGASSLLKPANFFS